MEQRCDNSLNRERSYSFLSYFTLYLSFIKPWVNSIFCVGYWIFLPSMDANNKYLGVTIKRGLTFVQYIAPIRQRVRTVRTRWHTLIGRQSWLDILNKLLLSDSSHADISIVNLGPHMPVQSPAAPSSWKYLPAIHFRRTWVWQQSKNLLKTESHAINNSFKVERARKVIDEL